MYPFGEGRENWDASRFLYYGLSALQGRGEACTSVAILTEDGLRVETTDGSVERLFERDVAKGFLGIGQVSPIQGDSIVSIDDPIELVLAGDGKPLLHADKRESFRIFAQRLSESISNSKSTSDHIGAVSALLNETGGGFSFLALTKDQEVFCARDRMGVKPLEVGSIGFDMGILSSETGALDVVGANHTGSVKPGEVVLLDPFSISRKMLKTSRIAHCAFEYVYLARLDSLMENRSINDVRERIGEVIADESPPIDVQEAVVIGVPETAIPFAISYSRRKNIPMRMGFVRTGRHTRTALKTNQFERVAGVQLKLNPIKSSIRGKETILIDDSVVRGNTLKNTVLNLKRKGATKVHVRVGSPALIAGCPYGVEVPPRDELIGRNVSEEEIADIIGADSFAYISTEGLSRAIGIPGEKLCMGCFTGKYPEKIE